MGYRAGFGVALAAALGFAACGGGDSAGVGLNGPSPPLDAGDGLDVIVDSDPRSDARTDDGTAPGDDAGADSAMPDEAGSDALTDATGDVLDADHAEAGHPVSLENALPGTTAWMLSSPATNREIEGYASHTSVAPGETLSFFVSTASTKYTLTIYRLGWYGGAGGREVMAAVERNGTLQAMPSADADGLVECAWSSPYDVTIPTGWRSGMYLAKLETKDTGKQSYVPFVVRDDLRRATYLFQSSVTTFQAYNNWGGRSLYDFNSTGGRAYRVSFARPYAMGLNPESAAGVGAGELVTNLQGAASSPPMGWELPMLRFLEREGYDVSYVTNVDVHRDPDLVAQHRALLSVGHDEYWTSEMRDHVEHARDRAGTSVGFFSGNVSYWQARLESAKSGAPHRTLACYKDDALDPLSSGSRAHETTVRFGSTFLRRGEVGLTGVALQDYAINGALVVSEPSSWVFTGTGLTTGASLSGLLGYEVEGVPATPLPGVFVLTRSPWTTPRGSGVANAVVRELPSGADVFAAGSIQFAWGLDSHRPASVTQPDVSSAVAQTIAKNVLARLAKPRPTKVNRTPTLLSDAFGVIDPARWSRGTVSEGAQAFDPQVGVSISNGRLTITPRTGVSGLRHGGLVSARTYSLRCGVASVRLVQATSSGSAADTTFAVAADAGNWLRMTVEGTALVLGVSKGGVISNVNVPYDSQAHGHLRLRHDCVNDVFSFETSPDGVSFTQRRAVPADASIVRAAYVELEAGTYQSESSPGVAIFDDVQVETRGVREDFSEQRDPDSLTPDALHEGGYDPRVRAIVHGGVLRIRPRANVVGQHHMGLASTREIDWTGGVASLKLLEAPSATTEASVSLAVLSQDPGWARIAISAGKIFFQMQDLAKQMSGTSTTFDPAEHVHLRLRHDTSGSSDDLVWETSVNGVSWTEQRRAARPFPVGSARAEVEAGTYRSEAQATEAVVDDFLFAR